MADSGVPQKRQPPTEARFKHLLVTGLDRAVSNHGRQKVAEAMDRSTRALHAVLEEGSIPEAKAIFDTLLIEPTVLTEILRHYGFELRPFHADAANDLDTAAGLSHAAGTIIEALRDGKRCGTETLAVAKLLRPLVPRISAIIEEADRLKGAA